MTTKEIIWSTLFLTISAFAALCFFLGACGCGGSPGPRLVVVSATPPLRRVESLRLTVETLDGERSLPLDVPVAGGPADVPPDRTVSVDVPRSGRVRVQVEALRDRQVVASGAGEGEGEVRVVLPGDAPPDLYPVVDLGAPDLPGDIATPDAPLPDIARDLTTLKDLAAPDLSQIDLSPPPDLAHRDLAQIAQADLAPPDLAPPPDLRPASPDLRECLASLAYVGTGDFTVAFTLANGALGKPSTLLAQRAACDDSHPYWYVGLKPDGGIYALTGGPTGYAGIDSSTTFNDKSRRVLLRRRGGSLTLVVDGVTEAGMPSTTSLDALAPLEVGKSAACGTAIVPGVAVDEVCLSIP